MFKGDDKMSKIIKWRNSDLSPSINKIRSLSEMDPTIPTSWLTLVLNDGEFIHCLSSADIDLVSGSNASITVQGETFTRSQIMGAYFGPAWDSNIIPVGFLSGCPNLIYLSPIPSTVSSIFEEVLSGAHSLLSLTIPTGVIGIDTGFLMNTNALTDVYVSSNFASALSNASGGHFVTSVGVSDPSALSYVNGVSIHGLTLTEFNDLALVLPNRDSGGSTPFRNLVHVDED